MYLFCCCVVLFVRMSDVLSALLSILKSDDTSLLCRILSLGDVYRISYTLNQSKLILEKQIIETIFHPIRKSQSKTKSSSSSSSSSSASTSTPLSEVVVEVSDSPKPKKKETIPHDLFSMPDSTPRLKSKYD